MSLIMAVLMRVDGCLSSSSGSGGAAAAVTRAFAVVRLAARDVVGLGVLRGQAAVVSARRLGHAVVRPRTLGAMRASARPLRQCLRNTKHVRYEWWWWWCVCLPLAHRGLYVCDDDDVCSTTNHIDFRRSAIPTKLQQQIKPTQIIE